MDFLLVNLAVADIVFCTFRIPGLILSHISTHPDGIAGKILCQVEERYRGLDCSVFLNLQSSCHCIRTLLYRDIPL